jgi:hypothetical protein
MTQYNYIIDSGTIVPDSAGVITDVQNEYKQALGQNINTDAATPQGALMTGETLARTSVLKNNAEVANQINPNLARGTFLDAVCALLGIERGQNQSTAATGIRITGNPSTVINAGSRVQTSNGDIFLLADAVTIPVGGVVNNAILVSQSYGPIPLPYETLTILDGTIGWGTCQVVVSQSLVVLGSTAMADNKLRNFRNQRLATQGIGSSAAVTANILGVANVTSCQVIENNTGATGTVNGVAFSLPNALWVCVAGTPNKDDLAMAMYEAHQGGCPWDYGQTVGAVVPGTPVDAPNGHQVVDPISLQPYRVKWTAPIDYDGYVHIEVHQQNTVADPESAVRNAILDYATGQMDGELGLVVGANLSAFEIAGAVARQIPGMYIKTCQVARVPKGNTAPIYPAGFSYEVISAPFDLVSLLSGNIQVVIV